MNFKFTNSAPTQNTPKLSGPTPSPYQQAILDWVDNSAGTSKAAVVNAVAGSGKSSTLRMIAEWSSDKYSNMINLAFNSHIAKENAEKNKVRNCAVKTYHSLGYSAIRKIYPQTKVDENKIETLLKMKLADNKRFLIPSIKRLVGLSKANAVEDPNNQQLYSASLDHDIELFEDQNPDLKFDVFDYTRKLLIESLQTVGTFIDFDDMIYVPVVNGMQPEQYELVMADEFQDTNFAQSQLVKMAASGVVIGVGDKFQSIYRFRGADSGAMDNLVRTLNADQLPLSISYRCPMSVGNWVRQEYPHIGFESPEWAIDGSVTTQDIGKIVESIKEGDMVLCRINKNLVPLLFHLLRKGITARIRGRDIGKSLQALIKKQNVQTLEELWMKLSDYRDKQFQKYWAANKPEKIQQLDDQIETLYALSEGLVAVWDLMQRCQDMFSDDKVGVILSTVHKAKGLEAKNVYIISPELLPLPFVLQKGNAEDIQSEHNIRYVAGTRALENLVFCQGEL